MCREDLFEAPDRHLCKEDFDKIVKDLTSSFNLLPWLWQRAPGNFKT